jgi:hypothetical protein
VIFGVSLGFFSAFVLGDWARQVGNNVPGVEILWYSAGAILGLVLMTGWRKAVLATVAPLIGGLLIASSVGVLLSRPVGGIPLHLTQSKVLYMVPPENILWPDAVLELLHGTGGSLVYHLVCALVSAFAYLTLRSRLIATLCLSFSILASGCVAAVGLGCDPTKQRCPAWMLPANHWQWPLVGSGMWLLITALSVWRQLGNVHDWSGYGMSRYIIDRGVSFKSGRELDSTQFDLASVPGSVPFVGNQNFVTNPNYIMYTPQE